MNRSTRPMRSLEVAAIACTVLVPLALAGGSEDAKYRAADAWQHEVFTGERGLEARNPGQRWNIHFDGRGFETHPDGAGWKWGLELMRWGRIDSTAELTTSPTVTFDEHRVHYVWSDQITEWYVNEARGLEHGYTLHSRVAGDGLLCFELAIRGGLLARVSEDGRSVRFGDEEGATVLNYSGLLVFDVNGNECDAYFHAVEGGVQLFVDDESACYPITIDPVAQQEFLKASNAEAFDQYGRDLAMDRDTVVVGALGERSLSSGVDSDQTNNGGATPGAAYAYFRTGTTWAQQAYLKPSNMNSQDLFGTSVAVSGNTIVVGARFEDSAARGVDSDQTDNSASAAGAAYVFFRVGRTWSQQAYLKASNTDQLDRFGFDVAVDGDTIVVGSIGESSNATGINGNQVDNSAVNSGAAYVFVRNGATWSQQAYLKASNTDAFDEFGWSVAVSLDTIVVGARQEASASVGVNGNQNDNGTCTAGAAYVFTRSGTSWSQQAYVKASNTGFGDRFGESVAISGDTILIASSNEASNATGVNGNQLDNSLFRAGAAYVFERTGSLWSQSTYLKASNTGQDDRFGISCAIHEDRLIIGANDEDSISVGINGEETNNFALNAGAAYLFRRSGPTWVQQAYLKPASANFFDSFGESVGVWGDTCVVGMPGDSSASVGIGGNPFDNSADTSGAAYVFTIPAELDFPDLCTGDGGDQMGCTDCPCNNNAAPSTIGGCLNPAGGAARILASGDPSVSLPGNDSSDLRFIATGLTALTFGVLLSDSAIGPLNMTNPCFGMGSGTQAADRDGLRCLFGGAIYRHNGRVSDASGDIGVTNAGWGGEFNPPAGLATQAGFSSGQTRFFQLTYRADPLLGCMRGLNTSQAIEVTFAP